MGVQIQGHDLIRHLAIVTVLASPMTNARILIYSATAGYRHDSIPTALKSLHEKSKTIQVVFEDTKDRGAFTDDNLSQYDAVLFLSNSDEGEHVVDSQYREAQRRIVLDDAGKAALQRYFDGGGNFVGIHSASACLYTTDFYRRQLGE